MKIIITVLISVLPLSTAFAAVTIVTIENFELWSNTYNSPQIRISDIVRDNPDNCADPDSYMVDESLSPEIKARIYSTLLTAVTTQKSVRIVLDGCESNRPKIISVLIK